MGIIRKKESPLTKDMTEFEKNLGVDLKLADTGDLEINNRRDITLISGLRNAAQAAVLRLLTEKGSWLLHPALGTTLQVGDKNTRLFDLQAQIIASLSVDSRFENVSVNLEILGNTVVVDLLVTLAGTGLQVPFQFAVER